MVSSVVRLAAWQGGGATVRPVLPGLERWGLRNPKETWRPRGWRSRGWGRGRRHVCALRCLRRPFSASGGADTSRNPGPGWSSGEGGAVGHDDVANAVMAGAEVGAGTRGAALYNWRDGV